MSNLENEIKELQHSIDQLKSLVVSAPGLRTTYIGNNTSLVRLKSGRRLYVDSRDINHGQEIMITGIWEKFNTDLFHNILKRGDTFVDVGANFGYFSILAGMLIGPKGKLYSFEPIPRVFDLLKKSLKANGYLQGKSKVFQMAVSDKIEEIDLFYKDGDYSGGSFYIPESRIKVEKFSSTKVKTITLDDQLSDIAVDFIKIDAEGSESKIINGMSQVIQNSPNLKILLEYNAASISKHQNVDQFKTKLNSFGFYFYAVGKDSSLRLVNPKDYNPPGNAYLLLSKNKF